MRSILRRLTLLLPLAVPAASAAQASATLLPATTLHRDVDRLVAHGLLDSVIVGQRPYSRATVARAVLAARVALDRLAETDDRRSAVSEEILARLGHEVAAELRALESGRWAATPALRRAELDAVWLGTAGREIPVDNGIGSVQASVNPLAPSPGGRTAIRGVSAFVEPLVEWRAGRALALAVQPRLLATGNGETDVEVARGFARLALGPIALQLGRDHLAWGQGITGGSLLSTEAPALDMALLATDRPVVLPWLLRHAGPVAASFYVARLDGDQNFPHPHLAGYKVSALPLRSLELGLAVHVKGGGDGGPPATFAERAADLFPLYDVIFKGDDDFQFSDKYAAADARLRLPVGGAELYGEVMLNDLDFNRLRSSFGEDASHVIGLWLPRLDGVGRLDGTLELRHTGIRHYRHHQFTSGMTLRGRLLGDPLGPDARGAYASLAWSGATWTRVTLDGAMEERRGDAYTDVTGGAATIDFERTETRPVERRARLVGGLEAGRGDGRLRLLVQAGVERATNWDFEPGASRTGAVGRVSLVLVPVGR